MGSVFVAIDRAVRLVEPYFPEKRRQRAIDKAVEFVTERLNGEDGLGGIYPAMANSLIMYLALGYPLDHLLVRDREKRGRQDGRTQQRHRLCPPTLCRRYGIRC